MLRVLDAAKLRGVCGFLHDCRKLKNRGLKFVDPLSRRVLKIVRKEGENVWKKTQLGEGALAPSPGNRDEVVYFASRSSTSKMRVELAGIGPTACGP